jgi:nucleotide-binding universal stress UspA family protein
MPGVVVGIDGSPPAEAALAFALEEARLRNLPLRIVCAWEIPAVQYAGAALRPAPDLSTEAERKADEVLAEALEEIGDHPGIPIETVAAAGHPPDVLVEQSVGATLLVVGTRGRGGFASVVLGSVSQSTAHRSSVTLVIVRSPESAR